MNNNYGNPYSYGYSGTGQLYGGNQVNPYYGQVNQPYQYGQTNNYQNTLPQQPASIRGRVVNSDQDIMPNEVPMDGNLILFPLSDYSCIYAKQWDRNGNGIITVKYVPEIVKEEEKVEEVIPNEALASINERLDEIQSMLKYRQNHRKQNYKNNQNGSNFHKKEVDNA